MSEIDQKDRGLYRKFRISRTDNRDEPGEKHCSCEYFVLDWDHDPHALAAIEAYIQSCQKDFPRLAMELGHKLKRARAYQRQQATA